MQSTTACTTCACEACPEDFQACDEQGVPCVAIVECMESTGCRGYSDCNRPDACASSFAAGVDAPLVDRLAACMTACGGCPPAGGTGGTGGASPECQQRYGSSRCMSCLCSCEVPVIDDCSKGTVDCSPVAACIAATGCFANTAACEPCQTVADQVGMPHAAPELGECTNRRGGGCPGCADAAEFRPCLDRLGADACGYCYCTSCEAGAIVACQAAATDCRALLDCVGATGCMDAADCDRPETCGGIISPGIPPSVVDGMIQCRMEGRCPSCFGSTGGGGTGGVGGAGGTGGASGYTSSCLVKYGGDMCWDCLCGALGPNDLLECTGGAVNADCETAARCMIQAGCSSYAECTSARQDVCRDVLERTQVYDGLASELGSAMESSCSADCQTSGWFDSPARECANRYGGSSCWPCACNLCDTTQFEDCTNGSLDCGPLMQCMIQTGCRSFPACNSIQTCASAFTTGIPPHIPDAIGACLDTECKACATAMSTGGACVSGATRPCYGGPPGTENVGTCRSGWEMCSGGAWGACASAVLPALEMCNGLDDDCNAATDDGFGATTCGLGICMRTQQTCVAGQLQTCTPGTPQPNDACGNGLDDDCDGEVDEPSCT